MLKLSKILDTVNNIAQILREYLSETYSIANALELRLSDIKTSMW